MNNGETINTLKARREQGFQNYGAVIGRYGSAVELIFARLIEGQVIRGTPLADLDGASLLKEARRLAAPYDAFRLELDAQMVAAGKAIGLDVVSSVPAYVTPGLADNATQAAPEEKS